jgi:hypothetical protein
MTWRDKESPGFRRGLLVHPRSPERKRRDPFHVQRRNLGALRKPGCFL